MLALSSSGIMFDKKSKAVNNKQQNKQPEPRRSAANGMVSFLRVLAAVGVVIGLQVTWVSFEVDRHALILQHFTGEDQVFRFLRDRFNSTGSLNAPDRDERERLLTDAHVLLQHLPSSAGAHGPHPLQVLRVEEGLRGSVTAPQALDVLLPLVMVQGVGRPRGKVASEEHFEAVVPFRGHARSLIFSRCLLSQQETDDKRKKRSGRRHFSEIQNELGYNNKLD